MSSYVDSPKPNDDLDVSQPQMRTNFSSANTTFGIDHYPFNDLSVSLGYHKVTHWPSETAPTSNASYAQMYGRQQTAPLGVLQYSVRGLANQVPSPVTLIQSQAAAITLANGATTNILDFNGIAQASFYVMGMDTGSIGFSVSFGVWNGATFDFNPISSVISGSTGNFFVLSSSGSVLRLQNASGSSKNNVYWTMQVLRLE